VVDPTLGAPLSLLGTAPTVDRRPVAVLDSIFEPIVETVDGDIPTVGLLIDGTWQPATSGATFDVVSPIDGSVIARAQRGGGHDVERAIAAAKQARGTIRDLPAAERIAICEDAAEVMREHVDAFVDAVTADLGKTTKAARSETDTTIQRLRLVREEVRSRPATGSWPRRRRTTRCRC
jgi:acyl-CoA reductase-like NAD-dependent aldehyde dehydrogenase